jgi:hypothetical protein
VVLDSLTNKPSWIKTSSKVKLYTLLDGTLAVEHANRFYPTKSVTASWIKNTSKVSLSYKSNQAQPPGKPKVKKVSPWRNHNPNWLRSSNCAYNFNY